jgi:hypothetical protein
MGPDSSPSNFTPEQYTPTAITTTFPVQVTIANNGFVNGQRLRATRFETLPFAIATGMEQLNNRLFEIGLVTTDTFCLYDVYGNGIDGRNYTPFVNNGLAQFTLTGPSLFIDNPAPPPPPPVALP